MLTLYEEMLTHTHSHLPLHRPSSTQIGSIPKIEPISTEAPLPFDLWENRWMADLLF